MNRAEVGRVKDDSVEMWHVSWASILTNTWPFRMTGKTKNKA